MVEVYSKGVVRATGKVFHMKLTRAPIKTHEGHDKWPLFVNKQLFWSVSITVDNNNDVLTNLWPLFSPYTLPQYLS